MSIFKITSPNQKLVVIKLKNMRVDHKVKRGKGIPHIRPILPVIKESKIALSEMVTEINRNFA